MEFLEFLSFDSNVQGSIKIRIASCKEILQSPRRLKIMLNPVVERFFSDFGELNFS